jgi:hypothetical protein
MCAGIVIVATGCLSNYRLNRLRPFGRQPINQAESWRRCRFSSHRIWRHTVNIYILSLASLPPTSRSESRIRTFSAVKYSSRKLTTAHDKTYSYTVLVN